MGYYSRNAETGEIKYGGRTLAEQQALSEKVSRDYIAEKLKQIESDKAKIAKAFDVAAKAMELSELHPTIKVEYSYMDEVSVSCTPDDLQHLRPVFGQMEVAGKDLACRNDPKCKEIEVRLRVLGEYRNVLTVSYITKLPRKKKGQPEPKCRVQRVVSKSYELVCSI